MSTDKARALADRCDGALSLDNYEDEIAATLRAQADELDRLRALVRCGCGDEFSPHDPGTCGNCKAGEVASLHVEIERLQADRGSQPAAADQPSLYAYSIDGGETYHGAHSSRGDAICAAHDELASDTEPGVICEVRTSRLVCGAVLLRKPVTLRALAESLAVQAEECLYDDVGGDDRLIRDLTQDELTAVGQAMVAALEATGAITGMGLADDETHEVEVL